MPFRLLARLVRWLRNMPIRRKLLLIILATSGLALSFAALGIVAADSILYRNSIKGDLSALAQIIAENTTAAISFNDPNAAAETLNTLHARPHVIAACVFDLRGSLFAKYVRAAASYPCPAPRRDEEVDFGPGVIAVSHPISVGDRRIGTLVLAYDLGAIAERIQIYGTTVGLVFILSTLVAFFMSSRLRALIATPIIKLAQTTAQVSVSRDYSIRAHKFSDDELGLLVDVFNEMLGRIQSRDQELRTALDAREDALKEVRQARDSLQTTLASIAQLNEELRTSNARLARSNEDLERFAFIASHDLQEPLRMIAIYSQLLIRSHAGVIDPQAASFMQNIESGTRRMRELLADLLAYAEIGAPSDVPAEPVDLNIVVQKVRETLALAIEETHTEITVTRLPVIHGSESHFIPLFQNLIGNAIKYRGDQPPEIKIAAGRVNGEIQICVTDNGMGIAPEYHSKIFVAFKRLHGKRIPGTGIGLAICQRVVERYGGHIWVESKLGAGANFIFTLPANLLVR